MAATPSIYVSKYRNALLARGVECSGWTARVATFRNAPDVWGTMTRREYEKGRIIEHDITYVSPL